MPHDALSSYNAAAQEHATVPSGSEQHDRSHEKVHADWNAAWEVFMTTQHFDAGDPRETTERQRNQQDRPIEPARFPVSAAGGQPCRKNQIERENAPPILFG